MYGYEKIINPKTGKELNIKSEYGKEILDKYENMINGQESKYEGIDLNNRPDNTYEHDGVDNNPILSNENINEALDFIDHISHSSENDTKISISKDGSYKLETSSDKSENKDKLTSSSIENGVILNNVENKDKLTSSSIENGVILNNVENNATDIVCINRETMTNRIHSLEQDVQSIKKILKNYADSIIF